MFHGRNVAVVIPCYQVARHIRGVLETIPSMVDSIVVVDDGSTDGLHAEVKRVRRHGLTIFRHDRNRGLAQAMRTGLTAAVDGGADIVVKMDGDGQMDPAYLVRLLLPIVRYDADFAKGNRFMHRRDMRGMPSVRFLGNLGLSFLTKLASGYWTIFDPTNGYVALRRELIEQMELSRLGPGYFFESSLLIEAYHAQAVVRDVPIPSRYGDEESSLSPIRVLLRFPSLLARATVRRLVIRYFLRDFSPVALFLLTGTVSAAAGGAFGGYHWFMNHGTGVATPTGTILLAVLPLLAGFHLLVQAVVMDIGNVPQRSPWRDLRDVPALLAGRGVGAAPPLAMGRRSAAER
jgi:glycosyltransferase involved in cell wall biosynthesis